MTDDFKAKHLRSIETAMTDLVTLENRTKSPASMAHQFLGTIVDNTTALLTAPANSLDGGNRFVTFSEESNWISLMQAVHRSFLSSMQIAIEAGLREVLKDAGIDKIEGRDGKRPIFEDYLEATLDLTLLTNKDKKKWRKFLSAFSIIRNKSSHSDTSLKEHEIETLRMGGFEALIQNEQLVMNPTIYIQISTFLLDFFDEIQKNLKPITPSA